MSRYSRHYLDDLPDLLAWVEYMLGIEYNLGIAVDHPEPVIS